MTNFIKEPRIQAVPDTAQSNGKNDNIIVGTL